MAKLFHPGYESLLVPGSLIDQLHSSKKIELPEIFRYKNYGTNIFFELQDELDPKHTVLCFFNGFDLIKIDNITNSNYSINPRNREQLFAHHILNSDKIPIVALTGPAGTGKTLLALAVAIEKMATKRYDSIIITRPMSQVGKYKLGTLPGGVEEKFGPYLLNYTTNISKIIGYDISPEDLNHHFKIDIVPLQLIRGASFNNSFIIADEIQVCDRQEILTLGTRVGENSKLVMMGDLDQRDEDITAEDTGLYSFVSSELVQDSPLAAHVHLVKCERSKVVELFIKALQEK